MKIGVVIYHVNINKYSIGELKLTSIAEKKLTPPQIILMVWIAFSVLYIAQDLWRSGIATSYRLGQQAGAGQLVNQTIAQAQKCEAFSLFSEAGRVELINVACLQQTEEAEATQ